MKEKDIENLLAWYSKYKRNLPWRNSKDSYQVWVSEIMLQQTRAETVIPYFERYIKEIPTLEVLASIEEEKLLKLWEGLGYYSRARNMKKCAKLLISKNQKNLPNTYEELINLPGIGSYTAGAIASIAFQERRCAVDGNVLRVISRFEGRYENVSDFKTRKKIEEYLNIIIPKESGDFNQALMELGAMICIPKNPRCNICPLKETCVGYEKGIMHFLPIKEKKKKPKIEKRKVTLLFYQDKIAIRKRSEKGLLASLWEFPNYDEDIDLSTLYKNSEIRKGNSYRHIFSHIIWDMNSYFIYLPKKPKTSFTWVTLEKLKKNYTLPSAFAYFIKDIELNIKSRS